MHPTPTSKRALWIGRGLLGLVVLVLAMDAVLQFLSPAFMVATMQASGFAADAGPRLAVITGLCAVLLALPRTALLGAILVTGFLGGAIAVHFRLGEVGSPPQLVCLLLGVATWVGLGLVHAPLRALILGPRAASPAPTAHGASATASS
jgi:hypothetical protein